MCGVGKFLVRWKESDRPDCPRCGEYEDARHVWICKSEEATYVWDNRMDKLFSWLTMIDTDPEIISAILTGLKTRRDPMLQIQQEVSTGIMDCITYQDEIGWDNFFSGFIHLGWAEHQQRFYEGRKSLRNGQQWMNHLLRHNWETAWDLWENRNHIKHQ
jgi:hypothetical protein